jgi:hypothetical protein
MRTEIEPAPDEGFAPNALNGIEDSDSIARSEANILRWMAYLPEDCIARMISMKWDVTT